jgi:hypothetical protein
MSNPTDTNQASKDGIRDLLRIIDIESGDEPDSYWIDESSIEKATAAIQELIRTEKLKLLAEMRELIVDKPTGNYNADSLLERDVLIYNQATAYLRTKLAEWLKESV